MEVTSHSLKAHNVPDLCHSFLIYFYRALIDGSWIVCLLLIFKYKAVERQCREAGY